MTGGGGEGEGESGREGERERERDWEGVVGGERYMYRVKEGDITLVLHLQNISTVHLACNFVPHF